MRGIRVPPIRVPTPVGISSGLLNGLVQIRNMPCADYRVCAMALGCFAVETLRHVSVAGAARKVELRDGNQVDVLNKLNARSLSISCRSTARTTRSG